MTNTSDINTPMEGTLIQLSTTDHPLYDNVVEACRTAIQKFSLIFKILANLYDQHQ
jgi:hypothetical protein